MQDTATTHASSDSQSVSSHSLYRRLATGVAAVGLTAGLAGCSPSDTMGGTVLTTGNVTEQLKSGSGTYATDIHGSVGSDGKITITGADVVLQESSSQAGCTDVVSNTTLTVDVKSANGKQSQVDTFQGGLQSYSNGPNGSTCEVQFTPDKPITVPKGDTVDVTTTDGQNKTPLTLLTWKDVGEKVVNTPGPLAAGSITDYASALRAGYGV